MISFKQVIQLSSRPIHLGRFDCTKKVKYSHYASMLKCTDIDRHRAIAYDAVAKRGAIKRSLQCHNTALNCRRSPRDKHSCRYAYAVYPILSFSIICLYSVHFWQTVYYSFKQSRLYTAKRHRANSRRSVCFYRTAVTCHKRASEESFCCVWLQQRTAKRMKVLPRERIDELISANLITRDECAGACQPASERTEPCWFSAWGVGAFG